MKNLQNIVQETSNARSNQYSYRAEIDGIRAFAVIAVIINHFNKDLLPSGYLGVDIFFVISGFVITSSIAGRPSKNFRDFLLGFYVRRTKRLIPALVMFVLITSVLICLFNPTPSWSLKTGMNALLGISNIYLNSESIDYFAVESSLNVFTHTWSLGVEEQFYVLFPFLVWFTGFGYLATKGAKNLFWVIGCLSVASLIAFVSISQTSQHHAAYFLMPTRLWELGAGCLLFLALKHSNRFLRVLERIPPWLVTSAIVAVLFVPIQFAVQATIGVVMLTAVLIACLRSGTNVYDLFTHPQVVYIGLISYSLYLWHWGILSLSRWTIGIQWWTVPFQIALMLLLSMVSYHYVETPLRRSDWSVVRWKSIVYGIGTSVSVAILLFALSEKPDRFLYLGQSPAYSSLTGTYSLKPVNSVWGGEKCVIRGNFEVGKKILVDDCTLGNFSNAKKRIFVIGNSFSASFTQAFDELVVSDGYSVTIISCWGASPVKEIPNNGPGDKANDYYWESVVPSFVSHLRPGDLVFLVNEMPDPNFSPNNSSRLEQLKIGLDAFSHDLSMRGIQLAILNGIPYAREANCDPARAEKQWFSPFGSPCNLMPSRRETLLRRDKLNSVLVSLEAEGKLLIIDIFDVFCPEEQCTYKAKNGQILYRDSTHPSVEGARLSSTIIRKVLTSL